MEPTRNPSPDIRPGRSVQPGAPMQRPLQRPVFNDFARPARTVDPSMRPASPQPVAQPKPPTSPELPTQPTHAPAHHAPHHPAPHPHPEHQPHPSAPAPMSTIPSALRPAAFADPAPQPVQAPTEQQAAPFVTESSTNTEAPTPPASEAPSSKEDKPAKPKSENGHAGLVGLAAFIAIGILYFLPLLPGKTLDNFPGSSASFSTGDQSLACITDLSNVKSTVKYNTKMGFPIVYSYSTTTTQSATCKGVPQSAVSGHTSQINPLGALIDAVTAFVIALVIAKIWARIFRKR